MHVSYLIFLQKSFCIFVVLSCFYMFVQIFFFFRVFQVCNIWPKLWWSVFQIHMHWLEFQSLESSFFRNCWQLFLLVFDVDPLDVVLSSAILVLFLCSYCYLVVRYPVVVGWCLFLLLVKEIGSLWNLHFVVIPLSVFLVLWWCCKSWPLVVGLFLSFGLFLYDRMVLVVEVWWICVHFILLVVYMVLVFPCGNVIWFWKCVRVFFWILSCFICRFSLVMFGVW